MTIQEVIKKVDALQPNTFKRIQKVEWLSALDFFVENEIYNNYEGYTPSFKGYDESTSDDTELLIPDEYASEIYVSYIQSKIDLSNNEIGRYNNSMSMFDAAYNNFKKSYNRTHKHKQTNITYY